MSIMEEKLDKLARTNRRLGSKNPSKDWQPEDSISKFHAFYEAKDRATGNFPFDGNVQEISDFYAGKDILITGATGFVGKVLVEKILRSIPHGGRIFLLIRERKEVSPQKRLESMLQLPLFQILMDGNPNAAKRLVAIKGDCSCLGLGLSRADRQTLIDNVSIVFNCAATVRFDTPTSAMILNNTRGTREVVYLCKELRKLHAFVHVSTAFCNATKDRYTPIPEQVIPPDVDWRTVIAAAEKSMSNTKDKAFDLIFEKLQPQHPNNYTFSKALSEIVVEEECKGLPAVIVRPSVVIASYEDPFGGWVDNLYGPMSIFDAVGQGILRVHYARGSVKLDLVPVDLCVKTLIAAAWHQGIGFRMRSDPDKIDVVNNCSGDFSCDSYDTFYARSEDVLDVCTRKYIFRYPRFCMTERFWLFRFITITSHVPLGILIDTVLRLKGRKPQLLKVYRRLYFAQVYCLHHFCTREFKFDATWQWNLQARMPEKDRQRFSYPSKTCSFDYSVDTIAGLIKYVFHQTPCTGEQSNRRVMHIVDWVQNVFLVILGWWIFSLVFLR